MTRPVRVGRFGPRYLVGGLIVGITSVGSGSLMIILLLFTYPLLSANQLVGTDLTQAVPLTAAYWLAILRPRRLRGDGRGEPAPAAPAVTEGAPERATPLDDVPVR